LPDSTVLVFAHHGQAQVGFNAVAAPQTVHCFPILLDAISPMFTARSLIRITVPTHAGEDVAGVSVLFGKARGQGPQFSDVVINVYGHVAVDIEMNGPSPISPVAWQLYLGWVRTTEERLAAVSQG